MPGFEEPRALTPDVFKRALGLFGFQWRWRALLSLYYFNYVLGLELVSKELNHLATILHVYAGGLIFFR